MGRAFKKAAELSRQQILADAMTLPGNASAPSTDDYPYGRFRVLQCKGYTDSSEQSLPEL